MKTPSIALALACLFVGGLTTAGIQSCAQKDEMPGKVSSKMDVGGPSAQLHEAMMSQMKDMNLTGNVDTDFASMMAEHHRAAVEMAEIELKHGKDAELKQMAKDIIRTQTAEIAVLEKHAKMSH